MTDKQTRRPNIISAALEVVQARKVGEWHPWFDVEPHVDTMNEAVAFANNELGDNDPLAILKLNCSDAAVLTRWEDAKQTWRDAGGQPTGKTLAELQALVEWNAKCIGIINEKLDS